MARALPTRVTSPHLDSRLQEVSLCFMFAAALNSRQQLLSISLFHAAKQNMERGELSPAAEQEKDDRMPTCAAEEGGRHEMVDSELEAAAALAGLSRRSALPSSGGALDPGELERQFPTAAADDTSAHHSYEDQSKSTQHLCDNHVSTTTAITPSEMTEKTVENTSSQLCSTSCQSSRIRPKLTEAEKETRKRRRVLANRESARQTIRRRQALYLELSGKAADLLQENDTLKKEKEAAAKEYDSLRDRNEVLKAELTKLHKAEQRDPQEDPNTSTSQPEESSSANSILLQNQPSVVPCFWPSLFPSSDILQSQCSSQGQDNSIGAPLFLFPIPFLLPIQTRDEGKNTDHLSTTCSCSGTGLNEDNSNNNNNNNNRNSQVEDTSNVNVVSAPESTTRTDLMEENREPDISPREDSDDAFAATIARRRRKELMKMKNKHCYQQHTR